MMNHEWLKLNDKVLTNKEAINQLQEFIILHQEQAGWDVTTIKALDRGIEALKKETKMLAEIENLHKYISKLESQIATEKVEIITCKDCKYYRKKGNKYSYCTKRLNVDSITDRYREPNFYCKDAESENKEYEAKVINRGNCMMCGKELTEGLFFCKECEEKVNSRK